MYMIYVYDYILIDGNNMMENVIVHPNAHLYEKIFAASYSYFLKEEDTYPLPKPFICLYV